CTTVAGTRTRSKDFSHQRSARRRARPFPTEHHAGQERGKPVVQPPNPQRPQFQPGPRVNLRELKPGDRIKLTGDIVVEVVENPEDGMWVRGKYITVPGNPNAEGTEDQIFAADVSERA